MSELYYIQQKAGRVIPPPKMDYLRKISEEYAFPVGAHPDVLGLSFHYGKHFAEQGDATGARYCWQITYELTDDEDISELSCPRSHSRTLIASEGRFVWVPRFRWKPW